MELLEHGIEARTLRIGSIFAGGLLRHRAHHLLVLDGRAQVEKTSRPGPAGELHYLVLVTLRSRSNRDQTSETVSSCKGSEARTLRYRFA